MPLNQSQFRVTAAKVDITSTLASIASSITVRDEAGALSDTARITLDDAAGAIRLPRIGVALTVELVDPKGHGLVFRGKVDGVQSQGGRSGGRTLVLSAKGMDTLSRLKEPMERHWDQATVGEALKAAGLAAGVSDVRVDPALAATARPYMAMQNESFVAFGQRLAREVGGTFRVSDDRAVLVRRGGGANASGEALAMVVAQWGVNLHSWDITPAHGRPRHRRARVRSYDRATARHHEAVVEVDDASTEATYAGAFDVADAAEAQVRAGADAGEIARRSGSGTVVIEGDTSAKPEALCQLAGARPGIDGAYRITAVEHELDRSGLTTSLELGQPQGGAGTDSRTT